MIPPTRWRKFKHRWSRRLGRWRVRIRRSTIRLVGVTTRLVRLGMEIGGAAAICYAAWLVAPPLGFLVLGVVLWLLAWYFDKD